MYEEKIFEVFTLIPQQFSCNVIRRESDPNRGRLHLSARRAACEQTTHVRNISCSASSSSVACGIPSACTRQHQWGGCHDFIT